MAENRGYPQYGAESNEGGIATEPVSGKKQRTEEELKNAQEELREKTGETVESAKKRGKDILDTQKTRASGELKKYGDALHSAASKLEEDDGMFAGAVHQAAGQLDKASHYIEEHPPEDVLRSVNGFAHRHSGIFWGGMLAAGLAASRFFKASQPSEESGYSGPQSDAEQ